VKASELIDVVSDKVSDIVHKEAPSHSGVTYVHVSSGQYTVRITFSLYEMAVRALTSISPARIRAFGNEMKVGTLI
jgi:hypothetical protein